MKQKNLYVIFGLLKKKQVLVKDLVLGLLILMLHKVLEELMAL